MDPTVSHRRLFRVPLWRRLLTRRRRKFDDYKRSKRLRCARSPAWRARYAVAFNRAHSAFLQLQLWFRCSCTPSTPAEPRSALFMFGALCFSFSLSLISLSLAFVCMRVLALGSPFPASCLSSRRRAATSGLAN